MQFRIEPGTKVPGYYQLSLRDNGGATLPSKSIEGFLKQGREESRKAWGKRTSGPLLIEDLVAMEQKAYAEANGAGYVTTQLTYPSYRALWRSLADG